MKTAPDIERMPDLSELLHPPTEEMKPLILESLREDEGRLEHNVKLLETWVSCQSHLPKNYDRILLTVFLRGCKHDLQRAKTKLENYFFCLTFDEVIFKNRVLTKEGDLSFTDFGFICPMPEMTADGCRVIIRGLTTKDDSIYNLVTFLRCEVIIYDLRCHCDTLTAGDIMVYDTKHFTAAHIGKTLRAEFKRMLDMLQNACASRIRQIHIMTMSPSAVKFVGLVKQIIPPKLAQRIFVHSDWDSLYKEIPKRLLPSDYGGEQKSCREIAEAWNRKIIENKEWFGKLEEIKVEGPMPQRYRQEFASDQYGAEGSFRKLNID